MPPVLGVCALCGARCVDLRHLLGACPAAATARQCVAPEAGGDVAKWCVSGGGSPEGLKARVRFLGTILDALVSTRRCKRAAGAALMLT